MVAPNYSYNATATRVIDGDTFLARLDVGFAEERGQPGILVPIRVRIRGVDAPEMKGATLPEAQKAKEFLENLLLPVNRYPVPLVVKTYKDESYSEDDRSIRRWVSDVWIKHSDKLVADILIENGHAAPYQPKRLGGFSPVPGFRPSVGVEEWSKWERAHYQAIADAGIEIPPIYDAQLHSKDNIIRAGAWESILGWRPNLPNTKEEG